MGIKDAVKVVARYVVECIGPDGKLKWRETAKNIWVDEGLQHVLDILFVSATSQIDPWHVGLIDGTPTVAGGDTLSSHGGWTEVTAYTEGSRQTYTDSRTGETVSNSASKASFSINSDGTTIGGAFLASDNTKGGTSGTLLSAAAFDGGDKSADDGDTINVQYDVSLSSS